MSEPPLARLFVGLIVSAGLIAIGYSLWRFLFVPNQWATLAAEYQARREQGSSISCWVSLRFPPFRHSLSRMGEYWDGCLTVTPRGLQFTCQVGGALLQEALLFPWGDLTLIGHRGRYEYESGGVFVCFAKVPTVRMRISGQAVDDLMKAGAPWSVASDGAILTKGFTIERPS
eukprot:TRINITY_DN1391_c0_g3_i5.p1 TRINITY_DN1391_c0_g3~~TRINITY_DN1391_c0_g3_i5.p1  ORF type:complete len:173 (+),score=18.09 TRINITY_DN1391_c0_g3_i5:878-1396(+)